MQGPLLAALPYTSPLAVEMPLVLWPLLAAKPYTSALAVEMAALLEPAAVAAEEARCW